MRDSFHQRPQDVASLRDRGYAGQALGTGFGDAINASPVATHKLRLTFTPSGGSETFSGVLTQGGDVLAFSLVASADANTAAEVGAEFKAYWDADASLASIAQATDNLNGTVDLLAFAAGAEHIFSLSTLVGNLAQSTLATGADSAAIAFGRAVIEVYNFAATSVFAGSQVRAVSDRFCAVPSATALPALSYSVAFTGTYTGDEIIVFTGAIKTALGPLPFTVRASGANVDAMLADAEAKINDTIGWFVTATDTAASDLITIAADAPGAYFTLFVYAEDADGTSAVIDVTTSNAGSDLCARLLGVTKYSHDVDTDTLGTYATSYRAGEGVKYTLPGNGVWVEVSAGTATKGGIVYVGTASGEEGKFYATAGTGRIGLPVEQAIWLGQSGTVGLLLIKNR